MSGKLINTLPCINFKTYAKNVKFSVNICNVKLNYNIWHRRKRAYK